LRVAIISDIHANLTAFEAVIADWGTVDAVWCLGDIVGYGPDPVACIDRLRGLTDVCVAGNHDWAATGRLDRSEFNDLAAFAAEWTYHQLPADTRSYLDGLDLVRVESEFTLAHGSPRDPIWEYILDRSQAAENFGWFGGPVCFVGHSHIPLAFSTDPPSTGVAPVVRLDRPRYRGASNLGERRHIINVGSVGQPRDGDPAARYVILDTERRLYYRRRVIYDVARTQERMRQAGLPPGLWLRLAHGR